MALQNAWNICVMRYLSTMDESERVKIMDDFRDALIDIKSTGKEALRANYEKWENKTWNTDCKKELTLWINNNRFESGEPSNIEEQYEFIRQINNYKRFRKIMQIIQDSGIGLGSGKERGHYELSGYMGGDTE